MDAQYYEILKKISKSEEKIHYSIPEFGMEFETVNPAITALYLFPMAIFPTEEGKRRVDKLDRTKVIEAMEMIDGLYEAGLTYIVLVGKDAQKALKILKKKYSSIIADDDKFKVIIKPNEIHIPIKMLNIADDTSFYLSEILSLFGVTVIHYDSFTVTVYYRGEKVIASFTEIPGFIRFVASYGFYIDEYLYGQLFSTIGGDRKDIVELLLNNLDCPFVRSLSSIIFYDQDSKNHFQDNDYYNVKVLVDIIDQMDFNFIKNFEYDFVSVMLYEK